jgi:sorting and assembly machinery component 37
MPVAADPGIILHVWPGAWNLPSVEPSCLAAVLYLQHTIPGNFNIVESGNPDVAPTGWYLLDPFDLLLMV